MRNLIAASALLLLGTGANAAPINIGFTISAFNSVDNEINFVPVSPITATGSFIFETTIVPAFSLWPLQTFKINLPDDFGAMEAQAVRRRGEKAFDFSIRTVGGVIKVPSTFIALTDVVIDGVLQPAPSRAVITSFTADYPFGIYSFDHPSGYVTSRIWLVGSESVPAPAALALFGAAAGVVLAARRKPRAA